MAGQRPSGGLSPGGRRRRLPTPHSGGSGLQHPLAAGIGGGACAGGTAPGGAGIPTHRALASGVGAGASHPVWGAARGPAVGGFGGGPVAQRDEFRSHPGFGAGRGPCRRLRRPPRWAPWGRLRQSGGGVTDCQPRFPYRLHRPAIPGPGSGRSGSLVGARLEEQLVGTPGQHGPARGLWAQPLRPRLDGHLDGRQSLSAASPSLPSGLASLPGLAPARLST